MVKVFLFTDDAVHLSETPRLHSTLIAEGRRVFVNREKNCMYIVKIFMQTVGFPAQSRYKAGIRYK